jgi:probable F420-dependent oxidoreductase
MKIGKLSVWAATEGMTAPDAAAFAKRVENWGYSALWIPEAVGRNVLVHSSWLLANTTSLIIATGIANIYARDPIAMASAQLALAEQSGGRFLLGLGVSHVPLVEGVRGHTFEKPIGKMRAYLMAMAKAPYIAPRPAEKPPILIAALGPQMLALTAELADGAHPYNVTPEHTAQARQILGPDKWICTEQKVMLETDPAVARAAARKNLAVYLPLPNYRNNLKRIGFTEADFENGGSDRLMDGLVAWGDEAAIRTRLQAHLDAGADQVCIQSVRADGDAGKPPDEKIFALLAPKNG